MSIQSTAAGKKQLNSSNSSHTTEYLGDGGLEIRNRFPHRKQEGESREEGLHNAWQNQTGMSSSFPEANQSVRTGLRMAKGRTSVKKVTLNNCLNFHFENRQMEGRRNTHPRRKTPVNVFNREEYLQANFKFDISEAVDTEQLVSTVDSKIEWEDVEMAVAEDYRCPISLEAPPVCPHITPCGHVFSFSSIIQHLMNAGGPSLFSSAPCPLCYAPFVAKSLRSVRFKHKQVPVVGQTWNFSLMKRNKKCAVPEKLTDVSDLEYESPVRYERYYVQKHVLKHFKTIAMDLAHNASQFSDEGDMEQMFELQSCYIAIENLSTRARDFETKRLEKLVAQGKKKLTTEQIHTSAQNTALAIKQTFHKTLGSTKALNLETPMAAALYTEAKGGVDSQQHDEEHLDIEWKDSEFANHEAEFDNFYHDILLEEDVPAKQNPVNLSDSYYFYQSEDGQWIFLHPVNISCLLRHYNHFENFPVHLSGKIVDIEEVIQSDLNRKRIRHLSHLPKHAVMQLVELDLSHHLPRNCLSAVAHRRARKQKKAEEEQNLLEQSYGKDEYYYAMESVIPIKQTLDITSMPPLSVKTFT
eukprot:g3049.t1